MSTSNERKQRRKNAFKIKNDFIHDLHMHRQKLVEEVNAEPSLFDRLMRWVVVKYYNVEPFNVKMSKIESINNLIEDVNYNYLAQPGGLNKIILRHRNQSSILDYAFTFFNSRTTQILNRAIFKEKNDPLLKPDPRLNL